MNGEATLRWWIKLSFDSPSGERWSGTLINQGATMDEGEWVVIHDRREAVIELNRPGFFWVAVDEGDRLVPAGCLAFAELVPVG